MQTALTKNSKRQSHRSVKAYGVAIWVLEFVVWDLFRISDFEFPPFAETRIIGGSYET